MNRTTGMQAGQVIGTMGGLQVMGLDIAKQVFQLYSVDMGTGEIINRQIKRAKLLEYFVNHRRCLIAMEACGGAHHWALTVKQQAYQVGFKSARPSRVGAGGGTVA